jgi:hypothetical protein
MDPSTAVYRGLYLAVTCAVMSSREHDIPRAGRDDLIPGFLIRRTGDDALEATRLYELDETLREYGCREVLHAASLAELELLACAERVKEGLINAAVRLARDTQPWREG